MIDTWAETSLKQKGTNFAWQQKKERCEVNVFLKENFFLPPTEKQKEFFCMIFFVASQERESQTFVMTEQNDNAEEEWKNCVFRAFFRKAKAVGELNKEEKN